MSDIKLIKQMKRNFRDQLKSPFATRITIKYNTEKPGNTNSQWADGIPFSYNDVPCLNEIVGSVYFNDSGMGNIQTNKGNWYIPFEGYDFNYEIKRNIRVYDPISKREFGVDKVVPFVPIGNGKYLCWMLIQK